MFINKFQAIMIVIYKLVETIYFTLAKYWQNIGNRYSPLVTYNQKIIGRRQYDMCMNLQNALVKD